MNEINLNSSLPESIKIGSFNVLKGNVKLGENVIIGNSCVISGDISIGDNCTIENGVELSGCIEIGKDCTLYSGVKFGGEAQHLQVSDNANKKIIVGDSNTFRENSTVHMPYHKQSTSIGHNNYIMVNVNIPHDAKIGSNNVICNNVSLGGSVELGNYCNIGLNAVIHQNIKVGSYSMVGMGTIVDKNILPFSMVSGSKKVALSINMVGFNRNYSGEIRMKDILSMLRDPFEPNISLLILREEIDNLEYNKNKGFYLLEP